MNTFINTFDTPYEMLCPSYYVILLLTDFALMMLLNVNKVLFQRY